MGDEIMIERLENAYNRRMSAYSRGGMYSYDPEEEEIFRDIYRNPRKDGPNIIDEGGSLNGKGNYKYELERI